MFPSLPFVRRNPHRLLQRLCQTPGDHSPLVDRCLFAACSVMVRSLFGDGSLLVRSGAVDGSVHGRCTAANGAFVGRCLFPPERSSSAQRVDLECSLSQRSSGPVCVFPARGKDGMKTASFRLSERSLNMGKLRSNKAVGDLQGKVGGLVYVHRADGVVVVRRAPERQAESTGSQINNQGHFAQGTLYDSAHRYLAAHTEI